MMWRNVALRCLRAGFFACSVAVLVATMGTVTSLWALPPPCPNGCDERLGCAGSLCNCHQTGYGSGQWDCFQPGS